MKDEWKSKMFSHMIDATVIMDEKNRLEMAGNEVVITYDRYFDKFELRYRPKKGDHK